MYSKRLLYLSYNLYCIFRISQTVTSGANGSNPLLSLSDMLLLYSFQIFMPNMSSSMWEMTFGIDGKYKSKEHLWYVLIHTGNTAKDLLRLIGSMKVMYLVYLHPY